MSIKNNKKTKYISVLAIALALSLVLGYIDSLLPINVLGMQVKIGLANIVSLILIFDRGLVQGVEVKYPHIMLIAVLRVCILSIIRANVVTFVLSLSGCIVSHLVMFAVGANAKPVGANAKPVGANAKPVGANACGARFNIVIMLTSILAAISHNYTQILVLMLINKNPKISLLFLPFLIVSVLTGAFTAFVTILCRFKKY